MNPGPHAKALGVLLTAIPAWGAVAALRGYTPTAWWALAGIFCLAAQTWIIPNQTVSGPAPWIPPPLPDPVVPADAPQP